MRPWLILAVLVLTMLGFVGSTIYSQHVAATLDDSATSIATNASPAIEHLAAARGELVRIAVAAASVVERPSAVPAVHTALLAAALSRLRQDLAAYAALPFYPREGMRYAELDRSLQALEDEVSRLSQVASGSAGDDRTLRTALTTRVLPATARVDRGIEALVAFNAEQQHRMALEIPRRRQLAARRGNILRALSAVLGLALMALVVRGIRDYQRLLASGRKLAAARASDAAAFAARLEAIIGSSVKIAGTIIGARGSAAVFQVIAEEARVLVDAQHSAVGGGADPSQRFDGLPPGFPSLGPFLGVPIVHEGNNVGNLYLARDPGRPPFTAEDERAAGLLASYLAVALATAKLYGEALAATLARDDMLATVSHDLRNPLNAITLATARLRRLSQGGKAADVAAAIERSVERMSLLVGDLLDAARIKAGGLEATSQPEDVSALVAAALELFGALAAERGIRLDSELPLEPAVVLCERHLILRVFANLISNAIKFSPPGTSVLVRAEALPDQISFSVKDAGPGIPAQHLPHVFDRYWQEKAADRRGAGLGLYIAKGIIEAHGGRIWIRSAPDMGTTLFFTLPRADRPHDAPAAAPV